MATQDRPGILIVEDEFLVALDLEDIVSGAGYKVLGIVGEARAIETIAAAPRVALVDLNLRDGPTGVEIAKALSARYGTRIIFVTANPDQISNPPPTAVGYVQKPFSPETIAGSLGFALGMGEASRPSGLYALG